jgi:hypothetical protein
MPADTLDLTAPYLSVVVTSRNDGHGGDPLARLQAFMNTFDAQCRRFALEAELVVVEWNPPPDRPRVHELVRVPPGCPFALRFVEVPPVLHDRLPRAQVLPLFQMIAKNAGIRRARGQYVLATNIDIIFSNELVEFFAARRLRPGVMYRVDRHDIVADYPTDASLDEQMAYCRGHQLRVHRSSGTHPVDRNGRMVPLSPDVFDQPSVTMGDGWHMREGDGSAGFYRWATDRASVLVSPPRTGAGDGSALALDIEPNPYDHGSWIELEVVDGEDVLVRTRISDRRVLSVPLANARGTRELVLRTVSAAESSARSLPAFERRPGLFYRLRSARLTRLPVPLAALQPYAMDRWRSVGGDVSIEQTASGIDVRSGRGQHSNCLRYGPLRAPRDELYTFVLDCAPVEGSPVLHVVDDRTDRSILSEQYETADCGRRQLFVSVHMTRGQLFSLYVANNHRGGDGVSRFVLHAVSGSVALDQLEPRGNALVLQTARRTASRIVRGAVRRARNLAFRARTNGRPSGADDPAGHVSPVRVGASGIPDLTARIEEYCKQHRPAALHRNAAGDFQLMARQHWFELRGYPEFTMYSMNVDGLMGDIAHHAGVREEVLPLPQCIYHLEHAEGSGWTPEGEGLLRKRLAASGADWLDAATVDLWSAYMDWLKRPMIFNGSDWGVGDATLRETTLQSIVGDR